MRVTRQTLPCEVVLAYYKVKQAMQPAAFQPLVGVAKKPAISKCVNTDNDLWFYHPPNSTGSAQLIRKKSVIVTYTREVQWNVLFYRVSHSTTPPLEKIRVKCLAQGHRDYFHLVGSGIQTSDLSVTDSTLTARLPAAPRSAQSSDGTVGVTN